MSLVASTSTAMRAQALDGLAEAWRFGHEVDLAQVFGRGSMDDPGGVVGGPHPGAPSRMERRAAQHSLAPLGKGVLAPPRWRPSPGVARGTACCGAEKLNPAPDEDGVTNPEDEAEVAALNAALDVEPGEMPDRDVIDAAHHALYDDQTIDCVRFDPPTSGDWCAIAPPTGDCTPPCIYADVAPCTVDSLPVDAVRRIVNVVDQSIGPVGEACAPDDPVTCNYEAKALVAEMLTQAWAQLYANRDLVEWVACTVYAESARPNTPWEWLEHAFGFAFSLADCLVRTVQGDAGFGITIELHDHSKGSFLTQGSRISVNLNAFSTAYFVPYFATLDPIERFCIITDLAGSILHELVHSCPEGGDVDTPRHGDDPGTCATSYLIENGFRWAMGQRYPCLLGSVGCCYYRDTNLWRNDWPAYPASPPAGVVDCQLNASGAVVVAFIAPNH